MAIRIAAKMDDKRQVIVRNCVVIIYKMKHYYLLLRYIFWDFIYLLLASRDVNLRLAGFLHSMLPTP
jgi:hypothetical protein